MKRLSPREIYRIEKERAQRERGLSHAELMAEAQRAFDKLLADAKAARKSGRPKRATTAAPEVSAKKAKTPAAPKAPAAKRPAAKRTAKKKATATKKSPARSKTSARTAAKGRTATKSKTAAAGKRAAKSARKTRKKR